MQSGDIELDENFSNELKKSIFDLKYMSIEVIVDLNKSVRQGKAVQQSCLAKNLVQRPTREDLVQRGILSISFSILENTESNSSSSITSKIPILERRLKEDIVLFCESTRL